MRRPKLPTLGAPQKNSVWGKVIGIALMVGLGAGGTYVLVKRQRDEKPVVAIPSSPPSAPPGVQGQALPDVPNETAPSPPAVVAVAQGPRAIELKIEGPLETGLIDAVGVDIGPALAQVLTRSLVWWVAVPQDLKRGDRLSVLYETRAGEEPIIHALRFESQKLGQTVEAYRFKPDGQPYPRFYLPTGEELELRLVRSPLEEYEQVTSRLRDGRGHKGVDFKTQVGTPVHAPFSGTITRRNWNFRGNGNSLELSDTSGRKALFLHLDVLPKSASLGKTVRPGEVIAQSGNSGHSFAPHLHYQLMNGERVLDPFRVEKTWRRKLSDSALPDFRAEMAALRKKLAPTEHAAIP